MVKMTKPTTSNSTRDNSKAITLRFNSLEWEQLQLGVKWLYKDKMILKPTPYRFLKWCGLTCADSLDDKHTDGGNDE
jgi:hypothetical protein